MIERKSNINLTIHGARGLFSLMVFFFHVGNSGVHGFSGSLGRWALDWLLLPLTFGVEMFFGISGIVILGALPRARSMGAFAWDRMTRIYPVLWITTLAISLVLFSGSVQRRHGLPPLGDWLLNFVAPPPFFNIPLVHMAAWSLGYEFTFYALMGTGWYLQRHRQYWAAALVTLVGLALLPYYPRGMLMVAGVLIALGHGRSGFIARWSRYPALNMIVAMTLWRYAAIKMGGHNTDLSLLYMSFTAWAAWVPLLLLTFAFGSVSLLGLAEGKGLMSRLMETKFMQWMGTISYSFYLWHPVALAGMKQLFRWSGGLSQWGGEWTPLLFGLSAIGPALLMSHISQRLLEVRLTKWLRKLGPDGRAAHAPVAATVTGS